jgi:hypothetical protein
MRRFIGGGRAIVGCSCSPSWAAAAPGRLAGGDDHDRAGAPPPSGVRSSQCLRDNGTIDTSTVSGKDGRALGPSPHPDRARQARPPGRTVDAPCGSGRPGPAS